MMLNILGMCRRAGRLECGFNKAIDCVKSNKAMLVIMSGHLSEKTKKEAEQNAACFALIKLGILER